MSTEDIPAICDPCLGSNPYLKMTRESNGAECKICTLPFTVYSWIPEIAGVNSRQRFKKTLICKKCSQQRNCCQSCLLDLTFHIPIHVRDSVLSMAGYKNFAKEEDYEAKNEVIKTYLSKHGEETLGSAGITRDSGAEVLERLAKILTQGPSNDAPGDEEKISAPQNPQELSKIVSKLPFKGSIKEYPSDTKLTSFFVFGVDDMLPEYKIRDFFKQFGAVKSVAINHKAACGYITMQTRADAENVAAKLEQPRSKSPGKFVIDNHVMRISWGKVRQITGSFADISGVIKKLIRSMAQKEGSLAPVSKPGKRKAETDRAEPAKRKREGAQAGTAIQTQNQKQSKYKSLDDFEE